MTKRIKIDQLIGNSQTGDVWRARKAYVPNASSRFAATQMDGVKSWTITHRRSGIGATSLVGRLSLKLDEALDVIAAWDAAEGVDWSVFDEIDETRWGGRASSGFKRQPPAGLPTRLREIAQGAVERIPSARHYA